MGRRSISIGAMLLGLVYSAAMASCQEPGPKPGPVPQVHFVPVTIVLNLDALKAKLFEPAAPEPGPRPDGTGLRSSDRTEGGLIQKLKERKPLLKLLALLAKSQGVAKELEKLNQPVEVGDQLWLTLNVREVVFHGIEISNNFREATIHLAVHLEPVLIVSNERPAAPALPPLPQLTLGKALPPQPQAGTPIDIFLKIDPKSFPKILPAETKEKLKQYGIDSAGITFAQQPAGAAQKLVVGVPLKKPLAATATVSFVPKIADNVLAFAEPDCAFAVVKDGGKADDPVQKTLEQLTQETIRSLVVGKLKSTEVDFAPYIKKMAKLPLGQPEANGPAKIRAPINDIRVEQLGAEGNRLVLRISGVVARGGIVIFAP